MDEIRRKLRARDGVTVIFALVIFLIMTLFSYVMVNASLTAVQGAYAGQFDQQAYLSTRSVAFMIRDALGAYPKFTKTDEGWRNADLESVILTPATNPHLYHIAYDYILPEFRKGVHSAVSWQVADTGGATVKEKFGVVKVTMEPNLDNDPPSVILKLEHLDSAGNSNYKMTVTMKGQYVTPPEPDTPYVSFSSAEMTAQQGIS